MLVDLMTGKRITRMPYAADYQRYLALMTAAEVAAIRTTLNGMIDGGEIHTAGWMPGRDWFDTPFHAIYEKAARGDYGLSARCFGLMVYETFMDRPETWTSGRFEKNGEPIGSRTYFQV